MIMNPSNDNPADLARLRAAIDAIDDELVAILRRRLDVALEIGAAKARAGIAVFNPARENDVLRRVLAGFRGSRFPERSIERMFTEIVGACRDAQRPLRIAYLGPQATYAHMALEQRFGSSALALPEETVADVFAAVARESADCGIVPIENSNEGSVTNTLDLLAEGRVSIIGEILQPVRHCLLASAPGMERVRRVMAHPQALAQCRRWLSRNLPHATLHETTSNGRAAEIAAGEEGTAAIAARIAHEVYRLEILAEGIEDNAENITRFFVIGREAGAPSGDDRTSLLISVKDKPGVLHDLLSIFARRGINMSRIESRPSRQKAWEYVFFVDVDGHVAEEPLCSALADLDGQVRQCKVLGSYPKAGTPA